MLLHQGLLIHTKKKLLRALRAYVWKRAGVMDQENYEVNKVLLKKNERTK